MTARRQQLMHQLIRAARGGGGGGDGGGKNASLSPLRCFALHEHHFGQIACANSQNGVENDAVASPSDFHSHLCEKIRHAQDRVILASLYIGVGSRATHLHENCKQKITSLPFSKEDEFLESLHQAASNEKLKQMQIILDANRAMRNVLLTNKCNSGQSHDSATDDSISTNSADTLLHIMKPFLDRQQKNNNSSSSSSSSSSNNNNGLFLFPVNDQRLCTILPSPLDEVAGVFHIKAYIVDDELILSGANLSEEYFSNRLDRYMLFTNGGGGLVDFYADLCDILGSYAVNFDGQSSLLLSTQHRNSSMKKKQLESSLTRLFVDETQTVFPSDSSPVAYAIPTFQMPTSFLGRPFLQFQSDTDATRNLMLAAVDSDQNLSVRLSSAYLNLTTRLRSVLTMFGNNQRGGAPYVLTAGAMSHGFAPRKKNKSTKTKGLVESIKASIPEAFLTLVKEASQSIIACGGKVLLYERPGWTFHAKGVWISESTTTPRPELIDDSASVVSTIIGSGNYGARSEDLDVESNCIIVFNEESNATKSIQQSVATEWNSMCQFCTDSHDLTFTDDANKLTKVVVQFMKKFL